jgi:LPXTG-motif cell wall-anchored protein
MVNGALDSNPHTVNFTAKCITATAKDGSPVAALLDTGTQARVTTSDDQWNEVKFIIGYDYYKQFEGHVATTNWPVRLIYEITEEPSDDLEYTHDATKYYVTVDVNLKKVWGSWQFTATPANPKPAKADGTVPEYATFQNYLLGDLTLEKQVDGGTVAQANGSFDFTVQVKKSESEVLPNWTVQVVKNGAPAGTAKTDTNGIIKLTGIKHGDKVQLRGIPLGCVWKITETNADGYIVSWTAGGTSGNSNVANGNIPAGGMNVKFTNKYAYELPETGGAGTIPYTMAGLVLMLFSMAYLMYRPKARGKGES